MAPEPDNARSGNSLDCTTHVGSWESEPTTLVRQQGMAGRCGASGRTFALLQSGATKESSITSPYLDDASVVLGTAAFRVRANRDRSLVNIEIAGRDRPDDWYPLEWVIAAVTETAAATPGAVGLEEGASLVQAHSQSIGKHMTGARAEETVALFNRFAEERLDALNRGRVAAPPG